MCIYDRSTEDIWTHISEHRSVSGSVTAARRTCAGSIGHREWQFQAMTAAPWSVRLGAYQGRLWWSQHLSNICIQISRWLCLPLHDVIVTVAGVWLNQSPRWGCERVLENSDGVWAWTECYVCKPELNLNELEKKYIYYVEFSSRTLDDIKSEDCRAYQIQVFLRF